MRILIPVDGSTPSRSVLQFVSDRAKQMPVMPVVQLLTVEPPVPSSGIGTMMELEAVRSAFAAEGERVLESLLPIAGGIPLYHAVVYGRPGEEIANASDTFCADLIAMGTHGRRGVSRLFIGSTSHSVLALVERPLLFIKGTQYPEPTENLHITLAVDGSKFGSAAAKFIVRSRDFFGPCPTVDVVSVLPDMERWLTNHSVGFESIVVKTRDRWRSGKKLSLCRLKYSRAPALMPAASNISANLRKQLRSMLERPAALLSSAAMAAETSCRLCSAPRLQSSALSLISRFSL